jgi:hypothetical protein
MAVRQFTFRRPRWHQRLWYWRTGQHTVMCTPLNPWTADWFRLLPYRPRRAHQWFARRHGFFWLPCMLCGKHYGGHESASGIPDPLEDGRMGYSVCRRCAWSRRKVQSW